MKDPNSTPPTYSFTDNGIPRGHQQYKEEKYRSIVENSVHAFFLTITDGSVLESNQGAFKMFGYSADEFRQLKRRDFIDHNDPNMILAMKKREETGFVICEATGIRKNGEHFPIEITSTIFIDADGVQKSSTMISDISLRKQTETAMRLSNERFNLVAKATKDLVWDWDLVTGEIYRSENGLTEVYGHRNNENIKDIQAWSGFLHPLDKDRIGQQIAYFINSKDETTFSFEYRFLKDDGTYVYINDKGYIIRNEEGKVIRMIGAAEDITDRKKTELALAESENRLRIIVQTDPECIKLINRQGIVLEMNPAGLAMVEADSAEQVVGKNLMELVLPEYRESFNNLIKDVFEGRPVKLEFKIKGFKGRELFMQSHCVPLRNAGEEIIAVLSVTRDITESKNVEAQLLASEESYRYLFNNNPASIIIWDMETQDILEVNETAVELYGYNREEFLTLHAADLLFKEHKNYPLKPVQQSGQNDHHRQQQVLHHLTRGGAIIIMEISSHEIIYKGKNAVLALGNNITEKIYLENSLNEERQIRQQQITEAVINGQEKERNQLGQELHDNINQILASTKLYLECALKSKEPRADLLEGSRLLIEKAMNEIRKLSKTLLPPSLGEISLLQALSELAGNIKQVNELAISVDCIDIDENEFPGKLKLAIFRIVQEQLNNIISHSGAGHVFINVKKMNGIIQVSIKDDGCGFDTSLKRNGVGLRNITSRAELHNGIAIINSKPGEGCELIVHFPFINTLKQSA